MFNDSCVRKLTPWHAHEEATALPLSIFPAYVGSGICTVSLDASGLQGLNHGMQGAFGVAPRMGDMYIVKQGRVGDRIDEMNWLPLGYLTWEMELDGERIDSSNLSSRAARWSRDVFIDEGRVTTSMLLDTKIWLTVSAFVPYGRTAPALEFSLSGYDFQHKPIKTPRIVRLKAGVRFLSRGGEALYDSVKPLGANELKLEAQGHELYQDVLRFSSSPALPAAYDAAESFFGFTWEATVAGERQDQRVVLSFDGEDLAGDYETLADNNTRLWMQYYASSAVVEGLDEREAFLYHNSLYLFRTGYHYEFGTQIGVPFYSPWYWRASMFWDSSSIVDALMRAGRREEAEKVLRFMLGSMKPKGKPLPWMFIYDGTPSIDPARDIAPLDSAAYASIAIKYYEYYQDRQGLAEFVFPILLRVSGYAANTLFGLDDGQWILSAPVSNDVVEEQGSEINQIYTELWYLVVMKKTLEYAKLLGREKDVNPRCAEILANHRIEKNDEEYLHCKGVTAAEHAWASWLPFLLYPTEAMPFVDMELFQKTRAKYSFADLYMEKQGDYQPWCEFMQASSDFRLGAVEEGYALRLSGMEHTFGPGYFSEVGPRQETGGLPPYMSAHGSFITALLYQFVGTSIWEERIGVFVCLPAAYRSRRVSASNMRCAGNIAVDAVYTPGEVCAKLTGDLSGYVVDVLIPQGVEPRSARLFVNGVHRGFVLDEGKRTVTLMFAEGEADPEIVLR